MKSVINRYYDPTTFQFLSIDPAVATTNQPYVFTNDNPLNATDPLGLANKQKRLKPATLTPKEQEAVSAARRGEPADKATLKSARNKQIYNEKNGYWPDGSSLNPGPLRNDQKRRPNASSFSWGWLGVAAVVVTKTVAGVACGVLTIETVAGAVAAAAACATATP